MGASLDIQGGNIVGEAPSGLKGAYVYLDFPVWALPRIS